MVLKINVSVLLLVACTSVSTAQRGIKISVPFTISKVAIDNNFGPGRKIGGNTVGYGVMATYSFRPSPIKAWKAFSMEVGAGFYQQRFNVSRPFRYASPVEILYYTKWYAYNNVVGVVGASYHHTIGKLWMFHAGASFLQMYTFSQRYEPTYNTGSGIDEERLNHKRAAGQTTLTYAGFSRPLGKQLAIGVELVIPAYVRWRNDQIFNDDPSGYSNTSLGIGGSVSVTYRLSGMD